MRRPNVGAAILRALGSTMTTAARRLGVGFNPLLTDELSSPTVAHVDAPLDAFTRLPTLRRPGLHVSAHVARAPVSEEPAIQDAYLAHALSPAVAAFDSIGFHLNGPYGSPLGRLGLGSDFVPDEQGRARATRFFERARDLGVPVLIENANFYDDSPAALIETVQFTNRLVEEVDARLILDLAHLRASAHNRNLDAAVLAGRVDLSKVALVHLSGVTPRGDLLHDGHDKPIDDETLELFERLLPFLPEDLTVVVEHTDPSWSSRLDAFRAQLDLVHGMLGHPEARVPGVDLGRVGAGYLSRFIVPHQLPALETLEPAQLHDLVASWVATVPSRGRDRVRAWDATTWCATGVDAVDLRAEFVAHLEDLAKEER